MSHSDEVSVANYGSDDKLIVEDGDEGFNEEGLVLEGDQDHWFIEQFSLKLSFPGC